MGKLKLCQAKVPTDPFPDYHDICVFLADSINSPNSLFNFHGIPTHIKIDQ